MLHANAVLTSGHHSRVADTEVHDDETATAAVAVLRRGAQCSAVVRSAAQWCAGASPVHRVLRTTQLASLTR